MFLKHILTQLQYFRLTGNRSIIFLLHSNPFPNARFPKYFSTQYSYYYFSHSSHISRIPKLPDVSSRRAV